MALANENILRRRRRVTLPQLETMWEFLDGHTELATGYNKSAQDREHSKRLWITIAKTLNAQREGATKDWRGWSNYWVDYKAKLKRRAAAVRSHNRSGGGPTHVPPFNDIELKFMGLLGNGFGGGSPNVQENPFPILPTSENPNILTSSPQNPSLSSSPAVGQTSPTLATPSSPPQAQEIIEHFTINDNARRSRPIWRGRMRKRVTPEVSRRNLVEICKERLEIQRGNQRILQKMLVALNLIAEKISRLAWVISNSKNLFAKK